MKTLGAALALLAVPASTPEPTFADAIEICRIGFVETITGQQAVKAKAALEALTPDQRQGVAVVCAAYTIGQGDLLEAMQGQPRKATLI
jgi:hypothetical protein